MRNLLGFLVIFAVSTFGLYGIYMMGPEVDKMKFAFPRDLEQLRILAEQMSSYRNEHISYTLLLFSVGYLFKQTYAIPGSFFMNLLAGALFGAIYGTLLVCSLNALGASFCYLLASTFGKSIVNKYLAGKLQSLKDRVSIEKEREFLFLLSARVFPFTPHWLLNICSPFIGIPLTTHFFSVLIGLIPYNILCVRAGCVLSDIRSTFDVFEYRTLAELFLLAIILSLAGR